MPTRQLDGVIRQLHRIADFESLDACSDGQLMDRFVGERDEFAFEMLVKRHGPMVLGVCRRILGQCQDAEDAFQATFLVLVRKASTVQPSDMVGNWLYGVACRTALKAKAMIGRRPTPQPLGDPMAQQTRDPSDTWCDLQAVLDEELEQLPEKYRIVLILCDLEGKSRREAASNLAIPEGTLSSRLATARRMLAQRLTRRGIALSAGALATLIGQNCAAADVPAALHASTVHAGVATAAGSGAEFVSPNVRALAEGVLKTMLLAKLKTVFAFVLVFALFTGGLITFAGHYATAQTDAKKDDSPKKTAPPPSKTEATEPKSADPKVEKKTPKTDPPAQADGMAALKDRLKKHEQDIAKIRQLMLNEIDAEIAKLDAAIAKAKDDSKKGDRTAFQKSAQLAGEKMRLKGMGMQVEHGIHLGGTSLKTPSAPIDAQIGLHLATPSSTLRQQLGLAKNAGLVIDKVSDDSSAGKAGLKAHDVLVQIDGKSVPSDVAAFRKLLAAMPPAAIVDVVVVRQGKQETIKGLMLPAAPHEVR